ncbi:putative FAD/NAD/ferredoxin protein [Novosphingobium nitrogenifigens DSM 19370]|uniref:Putative FAD/NAD/ferredoxin protein n=1 Tax=Novosphingobium nitrogenifigens DSM 19370 TaxID=983920 RepID=F1ZBV6_9SPHN|nr:hybrid-cluster NAD(P)-dependent oxidoreductase [Novosphingobium nitrogenifigens]EGD57968.1 putative FAD/NAD/ferredoxin protein [Novosphingobium nitrogenifigens DSM 19370]
MSVLALGCEAGTRFWDRETDGELVCIGVHAETHDISTFTFAGSEGQSFAFQPGQYFTFEVPLDESVEQRCYSISSSPMRPRTIAVTVKRVADGRVSNWFHDHLKPGDRLRAMGPLGVFTPPADYRGKLLLLAGGSGITPMMAIARAHADACRMPDTVLIEAARTPADLAFADDLLAMSKGAGPFRPVLLPETVPMGQAWQGLVGRISAPLLQAAVPDLAERLVMVCGPAPFMAAAREICATLGLPADRYMEESFDAAGDLPDAPEPEGAAQFSVTFSRQGKTIAVGAGQPILSAARAQGVVLPSSCATGLCGTCKSKLVSGKVEMKHNGGIRQREIDAGMILPCCATPLGDLVIER